MLEKAQWARLTALAILLFRDGRLAEADKALQELIETDANDSAYQIAQAYACAETPTPLSRGWSARTSSATPARRDEVVLAIRADSWRSALGRVPAQDGSGDNPRVTWNPYRSDH
jgi:hypothetical protein